MPFLTSPEYDYSYNKSISQPLKRHKNRDGEIRRIKDNIRPPQGFPYVNSTIGRTNTKHKFIYTIRHGKARHNALTREFTKAISWRFLGKLADNFDPELTPDGVQDARHAGQLLRDLISEESAPRPITVYTSPLRRCIQTAMYTISELRLDQPIILHVKEGLREWKGYDHDHQSDRRDVTPNIVKLFTSLNEKLDLDVELKLDGTQDIGDSPVMRETYIDVDRRVRQVLDDVFNGDDADCAMLVLHNRSNKSVLRVLGHTQSEVHKLDKENCAILGYLMGREALSDAAAVAREKAEDVQWFKDKELAENEKGERHEKAALDIREYRRNNQEKLRKLRSHLALGATRGDVEAAKALADLYTLAPELKSARK